MALTPSLPASWCKVFPLPKCCRPLPHTPNYCSCRHRTHTHTQVCSLGRPVPYYLNRNVITLLVNNGVPGQVFLDRQREMVG